MKRTLFAALIALPSLALPALAETAPTAAPPAPRPTHAPAHAPAHARVTWQQHFAQANTAHDGHLTLPEARAGYATLSKHFADIDTGGKGFVTVEEVNAWHKLQRAQHQTAPVNNLRPRAALYHPTNAHPPVKASTHSVVPGVTPSGGNPPG
jgi:hypothetical protein